jgi:hypothetical protein
MSSKLNPSGFSLLIYSAEGGGGAWMLSEGGVPWTQPVLSRAFWAGDERSDEGEGDTGIH